MEAAAVPRPRERRWGEIFERRGFLASLLISPASLFILLLVGGPLVLAIELSFTDATAGSLSGAWIGLGNFRDLDYHFVAPIVFTAGQKLVLAADCTSPGCTPGAYFAGFLLRG